MNAEVRKMTYRRMRKLGEIVVIFAVAFLVAVITAQAATLASAQRKALKIQANDCKWGNPLLYNCEHPYFLFPQCQDTGVNQPGKPQHVCGGVFVRQGRLNKKTQFCYTVYFLSPWNAELYGSGYQCYGSLLSSRDHK